MKKLVLMLFAVVLSSVSMAQKHEVLLITDSTNMNITISVEYIDGVFLNVVSYIYRGSQKKVAMTDAKRIESDFFTAHDDPGLLIGGGWTCTVTARQVDGKGLPELILRIYSYMPNYHGDLSKGKEIRIWNLETGIEMFVAAPYSNTVGTSNRAYYKYPVDSVLRAKLNGENGFEEGEAIEDKLPSDYREDDNDENGDTIFITGIDWWTCNWIYDLKITGKGKIIISKIELQSNYEANDDNGNYYVNRKCDWCKPDHEEGVYVIKDGIFVKK